MVNLKILLAHNQKYKENNHTIIIIILNGIKHPILSHFGCQGHHFAVMTMLSSQMHSFCNTSWTIFRFKVCDVQTPAQ